MTCEQCSAPILLAVTGRPRRFCDGACRQAAYRHRHAAHRALRKPLILTALVGTNAVQFAQVMSLHVPVGSLVADVTYGRGAFWRRVPPDAYRVLATDIQTGTDLRNLPYTDGSIDALVLDPPYMAGFYCTSTQQMAGQGSHAPFRERYSTGQPTPDDGGPKWHAAVLALYVAGAREAHRVLRNRGVLIVKVMDEVSSNTQFYTHVEVINACKAMGFESLDLFVLQRQNRPAVSRHGRQLHGRKNHSFFILLEKRMGR